ncbi:MAG: glycosyltransferase family 2 protein [Gemmataceae bacterium]|nr:glycosyltransferase family 2 protein [Gemmataceae bacterium]
MDRLPFVSVVIVNFNGREHLGACLDSLARQSYPRHLFEVLLIDNHSLDDSVDFVRAQYPWVNIRRLNDNRGFAGGNNAGMATARGEWFALLNADAVAEPHWLREGIRAGESSPDIGSVASRLVFRDDPWMFNSTGLELYHDGRAGDLDGLAAAARDRPGGDVFVGCGAALFLRATAITDLGGFDDRLFLYSEDLDLAWRLRRAGWRCVYCPASRATHVGSGTVGRASPFQTRYVERNRVLVNVRHAPIWLAVLNGLGLVARLGRSVGRRFTGRTTSGQVLAHVRALAGVVRYLPAFTLDRVRSGGADRLFRRWSRPLPR